MNEQETRCDAQTAVKVTDEHGKSLPDEAKPCEHPAKYIVTRHFSDIANNLCGVHARRYKTVGWAKVRDLGAKAP